MRSVIATTAVVLLAFGALLGCNSTGTPAASFIAAESPSASAAATSAAPTTAAPTTTAPTSAEPSASAIAAATAAAPTATDAPTQAPSQAPTQAPTQSPTQAPTVAPTPTPTPTPAGTPAPNFPGPIITNASGPVPPSFARFGAKLVDATSGRPVVGACVYTGPPAGCPPAHYVSDSTGFVAMDLPAGSQWAFTVQHPAYKSLLSVPVTGGSSPTLSMTRNP